MHWVSMDTGAVESAAAADASADGSATMSLVTAAIDVSDPSAADSKDGAADTADVAVVRACALVTTPTTASEVSVSASISISAPLVGTAVTVSLT